MGSSILNKRDTTFDSIKFVLISLVVLGHSCQINMEGGVNSQMFTFINSFHMPAFVLVSGYFYKDAEPAKFYRNILELLMIIIIFQIIYFSRKWLDPFDFSFKGILDRLSHIYLPVRAMWYILSLCFWRVFCFYYPRKWRDNYKITLPIAVIFSIIVGFIPIGGEFSFQRTFTFFPFFLLGYYIHKLRLWSRIRNIKTWKCMSIIIAYSIAIMMIPNFPDSMLTGSLHYWKGLTNWMVMMGLRIASYFWMLPFVICVLNIIPNCKFFAEQGKNTIFYLLYHPYLIWVVNYCVISYQLPSSTLFLILYTIISMSIMYWLSKIPLLNYLTKPVTTIRSKI